MIQVTKKTKRQYNAKLLDWKKTNNINVASLVKSIDSWSGYVINYATLKKEMERIVSSYEAIIASYERLYEETLELYNKSRGNN